MKKPDFNFVEIGISYGKYEFALAFAYPINLQLRRYCLGSMERVPLRDWLEADFPLILAHRLNLIHCDRLKLDYVRSFRPSSLPYPIIIAHGNSLPDSWLNPFVHLIAETFLNTFANEYNEK